MEDKKNKEIIDLVERAKNGEEEAFGLIYDRFLTQIYRFIFLKVSNQHDAEDLSQQVFIKAWGAIDRFEEEGAPFESWLYKIARNLVIDFYRTKKSTTELEENMMIIDSRIDTEEVIFLKQSGSKIVKAIGCLTDEQQNIIILRYTEDLSYKEISKIMKKNQPALRILQHRAINKLKAILEKEEFK